jgi:hypothetical protein
MGIFLEKRFFSTIHSIFFIKKSLKLCQIVYITKLKKPPYSRLVKQQKEGLCRIGDGEKVVGCPHFQGPNVIRTYGVYFVGLYEEDR